jgi:hypothetical protein
MGLLNDPLGERLPDELWRQAAPEAEAELGGNEAYKEAKSIKSNYEFPADLIRHCEQEALEAVAADTADLVRAVLSASGYAELVAALEKARDELESWYDAKNVLATINAALAAAGHKQGGGDTIITKGAYRGDKRLLDDMYGGTDD